MVRELVIGRHTVPVEILREDDPLQSDEIPLNVGSDDPAAIDAAVAQAVRERVWFVGEDVTQKEIVQGFRLRIAEGISVDLFAITSPRLTQSRVETICATLSRIYGCLRDPSLWRLRSIQLMPKNVHNTKNGEFQRGAEHILQAGFLLYPAALAEEKYRGTLPCGWLEGTVIHETTHVCLDKMLQTYWTDAETDLGWRMLTGRTRVKLPGGNVTNIVNVLPETCATPYGVLQQDDDRAESVVSFLVGGPLCELRRNLVTRVLYPPSSPHVATYDWDIEEAPPSTFTELPALVFRCSALRSGAFRGIRKHEEPPLTVYPLAEFLRLFRAGRLPEATG